MWFLQDLGLLAELLAYVALGPGACGRDGGGVASGHHGWPRLLPHLGLMCASFWVCVQALFNLLGFQAGPGVRVLNQQG